MIKRNLNTVEKQKVAAGKNTYMQMLISPQEGPNFAMRRFIIEAGGSMPLHTNLVEHEQLVLNGRAEVQIADKIYEVKKDDVVLIPQGVPHSYKTLGDQSFEFLCMVPNKEDKIEICKE